MYINLFDSQDNSVGRHYVGVPDSPSLLPSCLLSNPLAFFAGPWNIQSSVLALGLCIWAFLLEMRLLWSSWSHLPLTLQVSAQMTPLITPLLPHDTPPFFFLNFFVWLACGILFSWPGIEPGPLAVKAWSPNHWVAWKISTSPYFSLHTAFTQTWCKLIF